MKPFNEISRLILEYQFSFREQHSSTDKVHGVIDMTEEDLEEEKNMHSLIFAFVKV